MNVSRMGWRNTIVRFAAGLLAAWVLLAGRVVAEDVKIQTWLDCFASEATSIGVEVFAPAAEGKYPAIILLHAIDGLDTGFGDHYRTVAESFARQGYVVDLVHYFDRTGTRSEDVQQTRDLFLNLLDAHADAAKKDAARRTFEAWVQVVGGAVRFAHGQDSVDGTHIGVVGVSLGAFVGLTAVGRENLGVAAVVELFGGLPGELTTTMKTLPPTLVIHGDKDGTIPVEKAYALYGWMAANKVPGEIVVYKNTDHLFWNGKKFDMLRGLDAQLKATQFLDRHLKQDVTKN
jgi:carboxymethylenebutenolidase